MSSMAEHYHVRRRHLSSTGSEDYEDEHLDPRIQVELEKLNKASEEINRLELELDDARASFRQTLSESTQKLDVLAKKLGSCVEKARPYYDARLKAKDAHLETQRAALRFERACSMHEAAKEMVQLAEQGYMRREQPSDPAWQEMLNHATMKVNEAEKERNESELEHQRTMTRFKVAEEQVQALQKELKRSIAKSKPYFEMKARFNQLMEEHKHKVSELEEDVSSAKSLYSTALRSLEAISDEIHRQRMERRQQQQLGVRGAGVGAESPLPPPSWDKGHGAEGSDTSYSHSLDPLGVLKVTPVASFSGSQRSRNLSGESCHGKDQNFVETVPEGLAPPVDVTVSSSASGEVMSSPVGSEQTVNKTMEEKLSGSADMSTSHSVERRVLIPADPLGVLPPIYTSSGGVVHAGHQMESISHPAFSGHAVGTRSSVPVTSVAHPMVSQAVLAGRSKSESTGQEKFVPPSVLHTNAERARRESYRKAVDRSERASGEYAFPEDEEGSELNDVYLGLPRAHPSHSQGGSDDETLRSVPGSLVSEGSRQRSYSNPVEMHGTAGTHPASPSHPIPTRVLPVQDALADGRKHGSAPEQSAEVSPATRRSHKLQGLILRVDASMDPMYPPHGAGTSRATPPTSRGKSATSPNPPPAPANTQQAPASTNGNTNNLRAAVAGEKPLTSPEPRAHSVPPTKPIIRSASNVSERSETELSEESVSATQSPTKPRSRLLNVPSSMDVVEDSSDTESLASTGPMLDDEQVEFLTMDFSSDALNRDNNDDDASGTYPVFLRRSNWSRMSLPPRLSHLESYLLQAKRISGELNSPDSNMGDTPTEEERAEIQQIMQDLTEECEDNMASDTEPCTENSADDEGEGKVFEGTDGAADCEKKAEGNRTEQDSTTRDKQTDQSASDSLQKTNTAEGETIVVRL